MKAKRLKPKGKVVSGKKYPAVLEKQMDRKADKQNRMVGKPADIAMAIQGSKMGYSNKPRVKPQKKA